MKKISRIIINSLANSSACLLDLSAGSFFLAILVAAGCIRQPVVEVGPAPYVCEFASGPIVIDGNLDETAWHSAEVITNFYVYTPKGSENLSPTEARILWDSDNLYVAITCTDADIWSYTGDQPSDALWLGDVGEIFIKPDYDNSVYYEFIATPNEAVYDARYPSRGAGGYHRFRSWSSGIRVKSVVNGTDDNPADMDVGYILEMAIPLEAFQGSTQPADGVIWAFGVFRYDFSKLFDERLLLMSIPEILNHGFHYYEGYTPLLFRAKGKVQGSR